MELKLKYLANHAFYIASFNRTFMELKPVPTVTVEQVNPTFNRTFMELKRFKRFCFSAGSTPFNRTFMELKLEVT